MVSPRRGLKVLAAGLLVLFLPGVASASGGESSGAIDADEGGQISIKVPEGLVLGSPISVADLQQYGVPSTDIDKIRRGEQPEPSGRSGEVHGSGWPDRFNRIDEWRESDDWPAMMRLGYYNGGNSGFGLEKIVGKHDLNTRIAKSVMQYPRVKEHDRGEAYRYYGTFARIGCTPIVCFPWPEFEEVKVVHDFRKLTDGRPFGTVTAYCLGKELCPPWVKDSYAP